MRAITVTTKELEDLFHIKWRSIKLSMKNKVVFHDENNVEITDEKLAILIIQFRNHGCIDIEEASKIYNISRIRLAYMAKSKIIPSFKISEEKEGSKGVKYLFLKSDLEKESEIIITYSQKTDVHEKINNLCIKITEKLLSGGMISFKEHEVFKMHMFGEMNFEQIAQKLKITREYTRQIYEKANRRILNRISGLIFYKEMYEKVQNENVVLTEAYNNLKKDITNIELRTQTDSVKLLPSILFVNLIDFDFSVRALNCLHNSEIHTVYDLVDFINQFHNLMMIRNLGKNTAREIIKFLFEHKLAKHKKDCKEFELVTDFPSSSKTK